MPFTLKRSRRQELTRSLVDAVKSIYTSDSRRSSRVEQLSPRLDVHLHAQYARRRHHSIMLLPNELLAHIFAMGAEDDTMFPVLVSHVCKAWYRLALHTPALWRRIALDSRLDMWNERIRRAKACTLDIQLVPRVVSLNGLYYTTTFDARTVQLYMHLVAPFISRWRSLEIRFNMHAPYLWNAALSTCCAQSSAVHAPYMRDLSLVYPGNDDTKEFTLFNGYAPRLRRVTLLGIRLAWLPSLFQQLAFLDYTHHGFTRGHEAASEVLHIIRVSSRLEDLRIAFPWQGDSTSRYSGEAPRSVHLSRLSALTVGIEGPEVPSALLLVLLHLSLPAVRSLRLLSRYPFRRPTLFPRLRHVLRAFPPLPALEYLYLEHGWLDSHFVFPLVHNLPRLQYLALLGPRVTGSLLRGLSEALCARNENSTYTSLKVLELVRCESLSAEDVVNAVMPRSVHEVPCVTMLVVRDCAGVELTGLRRLKSTGIVVKTWARSGQSGKRARTFSRH